MKRKGTALILLVFLAVSLVFPAAVFAQSPRVDDGAGLLTAAEAARLEDQAAQIEQKYGLDVRIVTVTSMGGSADAQTYAKQLYTQRGYGSGSDASGVLFMIAASDRKYALIAHGQGNQVLTDYGREALIDDAKPQLSDGEYAGAFETYLDTMADYAEDYYVKGKAYDRPDLVSPLLRLLQFGLPPVVGILVVRSMAGQMKTARRQDYAFSYVKDGQIRGGSGGSGREGLHLLDSSDDYLYSQRALVPLPPVHHDGGGGFFGGGGTTIDAGGFSGSSGDF